MDVEMLFNENVAKKSDQSSKRKLVFSFAFIFFFVGYFLVILGSPIGLSSISRNIKANQVNKYAIDIYDKETYKGYMERKTIYNLYLPPSTKMLKKDIKESDNNLPYCYEIDIFRTKEDSKCTEDRFCYSESIEFKQYGYINSSCSSWNDIVESENFFWPYFREYYLQNYLWNTLVDINRKWNASQYIILTQPLIYEITKSYQTLYDNINVIDEKLTLQELPPTHISYLFVSQLQSLSEYINKSAKPSFVDWYKSKPREAYNDSPRYESVPFELSAVGFDCSNDDCDMDKMEGLLWINGKYDLTDTTMFPITWTYVILRETGHSTFYMSRFIVDEIKEEFTTRSPQNGLKLYEVVVKWLLLQLKQEYVSYMFLNSIKKDVSREENVVKNDVIVDFLSQNIDFVLDDHSDSLVLDDLNIYFPCAVSNALIAQFFLSTSEISILNVDNVYHYQTLNTLCDCLYNNSFVTDTCNLRHDDWYNSVESIILQYEYDAINKYRIICGFYNYTKYWTKHDSIAKYYMNKYNYASVEGLVSVVFGEDIIDHKYAGDVILNNILPNHSKYFQLEADDWLKFFNTINSENGAAVLSDYIEAVFKETANPHYMLDITVEMTNEQNRQFLDILYDFVMKCVNKLYPTGSAKKIQLSVDDLYVNGYIDPFLAYYKDVMEITNLESYRFSLVKYRGFLSNASPVKQISCIATGKKNFNESYTIISASNQETYGIYNNNTNLFGYVFYRFPPTLPDIEDSNAKEFDVFIQYLFRSVHMSPLSSDSMKLEEETIKYVEYAISDYYKMDIDNNDDSFNLGVGPMFHHLSFVTGIDSSFTDCKKNYTLRMKQNNNCSHMILEPKLGYVLNLSLNFQYHLNLSSGDMVLYSEKMLLGSELYNVKEIMSTYSMLDRVETWETVLLYGGIMLMVITTFLLAFYCFLNTATSRMIVPQSDNNSGYSGNQEVNNVNSTPVAARHLVQSYGSHNESIIPVIRQSKMTINSQNL